PTHYYSTPPARLPGAWTAVPPPVLPRPWSMGEYDVRAVAAGAAPAVKGSAHGGPVGGRRGRRVVTIDAAVLSAAEYLPRHCARHGRPASRLLSFQFLSRPSVRRLLSGSMPGIGAIFDPDIVKPRVIRDRDESFWPNCNRRG